MTHLPKSLRDLIETGPLAHLSTVNADGSPQASVVWVDRDGDDLVSGHMAFYQKLRNVQREPRVVLTIEAPRVPGVYLAEHAVLHATAAAEVGGARDLLTSLGRRYVAPDFVFPLPDGTEGYLLRYTVERIGGVGPWATKRS